MKKLLSCMVTIAIIATIALIPAEGYSQPTWRLYDNFNSGVIDPDRWIVSESSGTISIENGMAKFEHVAGPPGASNLLIFNKKPGYLKKIKGIRAKVMVESCTGDVRGQISGIIGKVGDDYVMDFMAVQAGLNQISNGLNVLQPATLDYLYDLFWGDFGYLGDILGNTYTITMIFSRKVMTYKVAGLGTIIFKLPQKLDPSDLFNRAISTRSNNGEGPCVVYFDDVYILK